MAKKRMKVLPWEERAVEAIFAELEDRSLAHEIKGNVDSDLYREIVEACVCHIRKAAANPQ